MKKVLPPHSRKRALSEEEKALWRAVAKSTTPLRRRKRCHLDDDEDEAADRSPAGRQTIPAVACASAAHSRPQSHHRRRLRRSDAGNNRGSQKAATPSMQDSICTA